MYYIIAHSIDIRKWKIYQKQLRNINFLLWRDSQNNIIAQTRFCTHLGAPLEKGKIVNDKLVCPFHWFSFDKTWKSNKCIPKIKNFKTIEKYGFIFVDIDGNWEFYDFIKKYNLNLKDYEIIPAYSKIYNLPVNLASSNFFDLNHFEHIHWLKVNEFKLIEKEKYLHFKAKWIYNPYFKFQKFLFKFLPNISENEVFYKKNFMFSRHVILNKKWKKIIEYYGLYPSSPIWKDKTLIISSIIVKKWLLSFLAKFYWKKVLFKATDEEFSMLEWWNYNIKNFVKWDELLQIYLDFYDKENKPL